MILCIKLRTHKEHSIRNLRLNVNQLHLASFAAFLGTTCASLLVEKLPRSISSCSTSCKGGKGAAWLVVLYLAAKPTDHSDCTGNVATVAKEWHFHLGANSRPEIQLDSC